MVRLSLRGEGKRWVPWCPANFFNSNGHKNGRFGQPHISEQQQAAAARQHNSTAQQDTTAQHITTARNNTTAQNDTAQQSTKRLRRTAQDGAGRCSTARAPKRQESAGRTLYLKNSGVLLLCRLVWSPRTLGQHEATRSTIASFPSSPAPDHRILSPFSSRSLHSDVVLSACHAA